MELVWSLWVYCEASPVLYVLVRVRRCRLLHSAESGRGELVFNMNYLALRVHVRK